MQWRSLIETCLNEQLLQLKFKCELVVHCTVYSTIGVAHIGFVPVSNIHTFLLLHCEHIHTTQTLFECVCEYKTI